MENLEKHKKIIPLFPTFQNNKKLRNNKEKEKGFISDSSDSGIFEESLESDKTEDNSNSNKINEINEKEKKFKPCLTLNSKSRISIDGFQDIEEYIANNNLDYENDDNINKSGKKEEKKDNNIYDIKGNKQENEKLKNDVFINKEGEIEISKNKNASIKVTKSLGPLMEEYENTNSSIIHQNKSIFNSKKEMWKFQKILLENHIIDIQSK